MNEQIAQKDFCFCTLALGERYQLMAKELAEDLKEYAPGFFLVVGTENPQFFQDCENVIAFKHFQTGILQCYNDKRFVITQGLKKFLTTIYIDADTKIFSPVPQSLQALSGITAYHRNLLEHLQKYRPQDIEEVKRVAIKLDVDINQVNWIGESLFMVTRDNGKEHEFIKYWGLIANYLELKGIHRAEGNILGLAAAKVGWQVEVNESLDALNKTRKHLDASLSKPKLTAWQQLKKRLGYHYRLNKTRIMAISSKEVSL